MAIAGPHLPARVSALNDIIHSLDSAVAAFSAGADSTLLLAVCVRVLGAERVLAATADSPTLPRAELAEARRLAASLGVRHVIATTDELSQPGFAGNSSERCYFCKKELFGQLRSLADRHGMAHVVYGATADDLGQHRPGMRAAREAGARAPLLEAGFTKADVRALSQQLGLSTWNKPSAACLSSRVPYGTPIDAKRLARIEQAEQFLARDIGLRQVRVRDHGSVARIEVETGDTPRLLEEMTRRLVVERLKALGFTYVSVDLQGFRSGSMDEVLQAVHAAGDTP